MFGRQIFYYLSEADADAINGMIQHGLQANHVYMGQPLPAIVVACRSEATGQYTELGFSVIASTVNLQVFLDGAGTYWVTERPCLDFQDPAADTRQGGFASDWFYDSATLGETLAKTAALALANNDG